MVRRVRHTETGREVMAFRIRREKPLIPGAVGQWIVWWEEAPALVNPETFARDYEELPASGAANDGTPV